MTREPVMTNQSRSLEQWQAADHARHLHPFTDQKALHARGTTMIERGEGVYVWDVAGRKLLDGMSGLWCVNVGYGREELVEAAAAQMRLLPYYNSFFNSSHPAATLLAEKLSDVAPGDLDRVFFTNSGSEAVDTAVRLARIHWEVRGKPEKNIIIGRRNGYHGSTIAAASVGGMAWMHCQGGLPLAGFEHVDQPYWYAEGGELTPHELGLRAARSLEERIEALGEDRVAAFIAEPIQGSGGVIVPPDSYWPEVRRICERHDMLFVADEVICGFGRTGRWFGTDYYQLKPDMMTIAKGLSSGYAPIGAVLVGPKVGDLLVDQAGFLAHGFTYSGHPVACAVALRNIELIEEERLVERAGDEIGLYFQTRWRELADHPLVGEARGVGLLAALEISHDKTARTRFDPARRAGLAIREQALANGLIVRAVGDAVVAAPPLVISRVEIDELVTKLHRSLDETQRILAN